MKAKIKLILQIIYCYINFNNIRYNILLSIKGVNTSWTKYGRAFYALNPRGSTWGKTVEFGDFVRIQGPNIRLGDNVYIGHNNYLFGKVDIKGDFMSGPNVSFMGGNHGFSESEIPMVKQEPIRVFSLTKMCGLVQMQSS